MALAFRLGNFEEVTVGKPRRLRQHGSGDCNFIVAGKSANNAVRRVADGRQSGAELRKRLCFDPFDQVREHAVKQADLLVVESFRTAKKQIGHPFENFSTPIVRACGQNSFEFEYDRRGLRHFLSWAGFFPPPSTNMPRVAPTCSGNISTGRKAYVKFGRATAQPKIMR